jgi:hypothetical protein
VETPPMKLNDINQENPFITKDNGDLFYKNHFVENFGDAEEALECAPDVVIGPKGIEYVNDNSDSPYIQKIHNIIIGPSYVVGHYFFKATENIESPQVPGFMTDEESVQQYMPGGVRSRHFGGTQLVRAKIDKIGKIQEPEQIETANFGYVFLLPGTPSIIDFGENDGVLVLQPLTVEIV